ncbi:hypothetical protein P3S67_029942 [Capsicum chacoense]
MMRQFDQPQYILHPPEWKPKHFDVDLHIRVGQSLVDWRGRYFNDWRGRYEKLVVLVHGVVVRDYTLWYLSHGRLLIGNPDIKEKVQRWICSSCWYCCCISVVNQTFEEARHAIPPDRPFCDADLSYYNVSARGRGEGRGRARGRSRPRGRPRNADVHELFNESSPFTPVVPSESIPNMSGAYRMRPMKLLSRPADGRPRRDVEAIHLSYGSAIGDGYIPDTPGPLVHKILGKH